MTPQDKDTLIQLLDRLSAGDLATLRSFAEFLASRGAGAPPLVAPAPAQPIPVPEPEPIARPQNEKVVAAVKRLSKTYFMLDKKEMLSVTSDLMTQHLVQGREAAEVIDEMEALFRESYDKLCGESDA